MRSTFMGLEASKRGLFTHQSALYTTGHNISNANTKGYSRQRVNMEPTPGFPTPGLNTQKTAGHIGTGVQAHSVQRIRDEFIDRQYRQETNKLGYWESRTNAISQMEDILAEPSKYGLDEAFRLFWSSLEDVSATPEDSSARKVALQRAQHLADSFNYIDTQLTQIQGNLGNEIDVTVQDMNSILKQIAEINEQIQAIEPNGYMPNDLYDARDVLVDQLNEYIPVTIERIPSGGNALDIAEGSLTISFNDTVLVQGKDFVQFTAKGADVEGTPGDIKDSEPYKFFTHLVTGKTIHKPSEDNDGNPIPGWVEDAEQQVNYNDFEPSKGRLISLIDSYGYVERDASGNLVEESGQYSIKGYYPETLANLDKLANVFASAFNALHKEGYTLDSTADMIDDPDGGLFFLGEGASGDNQGTITAGSIKVNTELLNNPSKIATSSAAGEEGNGKWALELANIQTKSITAGGFKVNVDGTETDIEWSIVPPATERVHLDGATFQSYYKAIIGKLGVDGQESSRLKTNAETIRLTVENNRASMSSVSLDEEMTDMIRFQQAYNANARMITVIDETLDKIINGMGRVGL